MNSIGEKDGVIIFYKRDAITPMGKIEFKNAYCCYFREEFDGEGGDPMKFKIVISANDLTINGVSAEHTLRQYIAVQTNISLPLMDFSVLSFPGKEGDEYTDPKTKQEYTYDDGKWHKIMQEIVVIPTKHDAPWMKIAQGELGVKEIKGIKNNPRVLEYHATTTYGAKNDETAWCASFVNWVLRQSNIPTINSARAFDWQKFGIELNRPAYGAIAIMNYSHVGFVAGINADGRIILLGGNQGTPIGYVNLSPNSKSDVLQYRYPKGYKPNYTLPHYNLRGRSLDMKSTR